MESRLYSRRTIIAAIGVAPLAACVGQATMTPVQVFDDVAAMVDSLVNALPAIDAIPGISSATFEKIASWLTQAQAAARRLTPDVDLAAAAPTIQHIVQLVDNAIGVLPLGLLPPAVAEVVAAASALLPIILASVGQPASAPMLERAAVSSMMPDEARAAVRRMSKR